MLVSGTDQFNALTLHKWDYLFYYSTQVSLVFIANLLPCLMCWPIMLEAVKPKVICQTCFFQGSYIAAKSASRSICGSTPSTGMSLKGRRTKSACCPSRLPSSSSVDPLTAWVSPLCSSLLPMTRSWRALLRGLSCRSSGLASDVCVWRPRPPSVGIGPTPALTLAWALPLILKLRVLRCPEKVISLWLDLWGEPWCAGIFSGSGRVKQWETILWCCIHYLCIVITLWTCYHIFFFMCFRATSRHWRHLIQFVLLSTSFSVQFECMLERSPFVLWELNPSGNLPSILETRSFWRAKVLWNVWIQGTFVLSNKRLKVHIHVPHIMYVLGTHTQIGIDCYSWKCSTCLVYLALQAYFAPFIEMQILHNLFSSLFLCQTAFILYIV